jgi:hypothetical protein
MTVEEFNPCDLNRDRVCDSKDESVFKESLGSCLGKDRYVRVADANLDGCVTQEDHALIFGR